MKQKFSMNKTYKSNRIGIKWKMFAILLIFVTLMSFVILFFQLGMLHPFYQKTKFNELQFAESVLVPTLDNESAREETAYSCADSYHNSIWIFSVSGESAEMLLEVNGAVDSLDSSMRFFRYWFPEMYDMGIQNGGSYMAVFSSDELGRGSSATPIADNFGDSKKLPMVRYYSDPLVAIRVSIHDVGGTCYAIMQVSNLTPVSAMVKTQNNQLLWIGVVLGILVLVLAEVLSRLITKPIVTMNLAAKELARGHYDAEFSGHGYREINELAGTLNYAAAELSKNDALQKELISNVSHDLRTPLTMIKGYSEVMRDIPGENTPENVQVIIDEAERLTELVNDMLDLSRIQAGIQKPNFEAFSLTDTVRATMSRYEKLIRQQGYHITFYAEDDARVYADRGMILQVVYNLINNAIHYTGEDRRVDVVQTLTEDAVRISIHDTGEGIAPDEIPLIWDRYYRIDRVHKRAAIGTGLGLSIVKGVLEMHRAVYGVQSTQGKGSVFWFELKLVSPLQDEIEEVK